jgi:hypothetical protein
MDSFHDSTDFVNDAPSCRAFYGSVDFRLVTGEESSKRALPPAAGCLFSVSFGLIGVLLVFAIFSLVQSGELTIRLGELREIRLWTISEGGIRGVGFSTPNVTGGSIGAGEVCVRTNVRIILWKTGEEFANPSYCECFQRTGEIWQSLGSCPTSLIRVGRSVAA